MFKKINIGLVILVALLIAAFLLRDECINKEDTVFKDGIIVYKDSVTIYEEDEVPLKRYMKEGKNVTDSLSQLDSIRSKDKAVGLIDSILIDTIDSNLPTNNFIYTGIRSYVEFNDK